MKKRTFHLWLIQFIGVLVPRRLRADWRQEWEAELRHRQQMLAEWDRLNWKHKFDLWRRSLGALRDALLLQPQRLEDEMFQDLRFGIRMLLKHKSFTAVAMLTLALGIGVNTALFSIVNAILLRPLPYAEPASLVQVYESNPQQDFTRFSFSLPNFVDHRAQQTSFEQMAAYQRRNASLIHDGAPERLQAGVVSASFLPLLRVQPLLGRAFLSEEETPGKHRVVLLSHDLWQRRFSANPGIINQSIKLGGNVYTVIGVLPPDFRFPDPFGNNPRSDIALKADLLMPLAYDPADLGDRGSHFLSVVARLKPGVAMEQAQAELRTIASRLEQQYPNHNKGWTVDVFALQDEVVRAIRPTLLLLAAAVGFVLLIACVNVANLLLARANSRQKEMAIRQALGAPRARLVRQSLTESLLLAGLGGAVGLGLAYWLIRAFISFSPANVPRTDVIRLDGTTLLFTFGISLLTSILFGLIPALQASRPDVHETIKADGRQIAHNAGRSGTRGLLVVVEVALSLLLLVGAGLMIRTFTSYLRVDPGFHAENRLTLKLTLPSAKYSEPRQKAAFYQEAIARLKAQPGVQAVGAVSDLPLSGEGGVFAFVIEGRPVASTQDNPSAVWRAINPDFFRALGMRLQRGREFTDHDREGAPEPVIVNEAFARRHWPNKDPLGKRIQIYDLEPMPWREIVGVVNDIRQTALDSETVPEIYVPFTQRPRTTMTLIAHTTGRPEHLAPALRAAVQSVDKEQAIYRVRTMEEFLDDALAAPRATMFLLGALAAVAVALAATGIYGVMSYTVTQRTPEIGIRMALGAHRRDVLGMLLRTGMKWTLAGVALGLGAAFALTRLMKELLFGVQATDPATFAGVVLLLAMIATLACYLPARRATKVDPLIALRHD